MEEEKKATELDTFLESISMQKYKEALLENGFESLKQLAEIKDEHFALMNMPLGHKLKILKRIKDLAIPAPKPAEQKQPPLHGIQKSVDVTHKPMMEPISETSLAKEEKKLSTLDTKSEKEDDAKPPKSKVSICDDITFISKIRRRRCALKKTRLSLIQKMIQKLI